MAQLRRGRGSASDFHDLPLRATGGPARRDLGVPGPRWMSLPPGQGGRPPAAAALRLASMSTDDIVRASRLLNNEVRVLKDELQRNNLELENFKDKIKENQEKVKLNKQLPYLVGNIVEILEMNPEDEAEEDGANIDLDSQRKGKCVVLKTSTRQCIKSLNTHEDSRRRGVARRLAAIRLAGRPSSEHAEQRRSEASSLLDLYYIYAIGCKMSKDQW